MSLFEAFNICILNYLGSSCSTQCDPCHILKIEYLYLTYLGSITHAVGHNTNALIAHIRSTARRGKFRELPRGGEGAVLTDCEADIRANHLHGALIIKA